jgi:hypothetical protein
MREAARAKLAGENEFEDAFGKKHQPDDHSDQEHGQVFAHRRSPVAALIASS